MRKFLIYLRLTWVKIVVIGLAVILSLLIGAFLFYSFREFSTLERFTRQNMLAQYGWLFIIFVLVQLISMPLMLALQYYFLQGGFSKIVSQRYDKAKVNVKWDDVIGMEDAKKEALELIKLLKDRAMLKAIGGKIIKGTLMVGPPGCGKTYLAKAIATECNLPLLTTVGSEFVGIFVGLGAGKMKALFRQARAMAEYEGGCIIFIDEIDSFARPRMTEMGLGAGLDHNATVNQFLTEMDGLRQIENNIAVIAATNVPEGELDPAIMRAGRFDRKIMVSRPNLAEREKLFTFYLSKVKTASTVNRNVLARKTVWFTPAEIENMVRESGLIALRDKRDVIDTKDLSAAYDRVSFGHKSNITLSENEKIMTAYHEAGHAVIYYLIHPTDDVMKATIVPRSGNLGYVFARPSEELHSYDRQHLLAEIKVCIASYCAERIKFKTTTTGVGGGKNSDFSKALQLAHDMVWRYGMGKSGLIGDFHTISSSLLSEKTKETLDHDVQDILQTCVKETEELLIQKWEVLDYFAQELVKQGELEFDEIEALFNKFNLKPISGRIHLKS